MKKRKLILLLVLAVVSLTLSTMALAVYTHTYHFTSISATEQVTLYFDEACTDPVPDPHDWGAVVSGVKTVYAKNTGDIIVYVILSISDEVGCTVTLNPMEFTISPTDLAVQIDMTVDVTALPGEPVSWSLDVSASAS